MPSRFELVRHGEARARVTIARRAAVPVHFAANELRRYLRELSGAALEIEQGAGSDAELRIEPLGKPAGRGKTASSPREEGRRPRRGAAEGDAYDVSVSDAGIRLRGDSPRAVVFAVYEMLEQLGCGFCVPGEDTIPHKRSLALPHGQRRIEPAFTYRAQVDFPLGSLCRSTTLIDWMAKNRLNCYHACPNARVLPVARRTPVAGAPPERWTDRREVVTAALAQRGLRLHFGGHTMMTWISNDYFADHPEWFALYDGKRGGPDPQTTNKPLCVSNAEMRRELVRNMRRFLKENPAAEVLDILHPDSDFFCHCEACLRGMSPDAGDEFVGMAYLKSYVAFANAVVEDLRRTHPHVRVGPLVNYSKSTNWPLPAGEAVHDGLLIGMAHFPPLRDSYLPLTGPMPGPGTGAVSTGNTRLLAIDLTWKAQAKHTYLYEYFNSWHMPFIHPQALLAGHDLKVLRTLGFTGLSSDMWGWTPVNLYVVARLMWDPSLSAEALVRDFCRRYYGAAAEAMHEHWMELERLFQGVPGYLSSEAAMALCRKHRRRAVGQIRAAAAAASDPMHRARVERCLLPWQHLGDRQAARWWAVPAFAEDDSKPD